MTGLLRELARVAREEWLHRSGRGAQAEAEADTRARREVEVQVARAKERAPFQRYRVEVAAWKDSCEDVLRRLENEMPYRGTSPETEPVVPRPPFMPSTSLVMWDRVWDNAVIMELRQEAEAWREERLARSFKNRDRG